MTDNELFTEIDEARGFAQAIIDTIREPFLVLDQDLRVLAASRSLSKRKLSSSPVRQCPPSSSAHSLTVS